MFLLYSWGSVFGVPRKVPLLLGQQGSGLRAYCTPRAMRLADALHQTLNLNPRALCTLLSFQKWIFAGFHVSLREGRGRIGSYGSFFRTKGLGSKVQGLGV